MPDCAAPGNRNLGREVSTQQLAAGQMALVGGRGAAWPDPLHLDVQVIVQRSHRRGVGPDLATLTESPAPNGYQPEFGEWSSAEIEPHQLPRTSQAST
jgi:hypothetical protein